MSASVEEVLAAVRAALETSEGGPGPSPWVQCSIGRVDTVRHYLPDAIVSGALIEPDRVVVHLRLPPGRPA